MGRLLLTVFLPLALSVSLVGSAAADVPLDDDRRSEAASASERRVMFLVAVAGAASILGALGLVARSRRRGAAPASAHAPVSDHAPASKGKKTAQKSETNPSLSTLGPAAALPENATGLPSLPKICPACGQRYASEARLCGDDQTALVLLN